ncbi:MAG: type I methionyl aminopeptidase [Candidatus Terrybacteria bacterium CG10_big_fil_rev_8_21_14_0_10_41_10]|uniref:Methionine aminopeptidase n=1 Tax=Candidatus Terrybacteria bacterium CG10_big_fil_rev_8_21_14_0_10_41_10 TaxID=1975026 RepID=A0A2M8L9Z3_9BACT|nr:MAG: type I methionyl aminopeptidase [Candidatus Terrybacteria bacterium CG10_big_fil_rev_8_21_14_0_10_41_10]
MTILKDRKEIEALRDGGKILASVLKAVMEGAKPGISSLALNNLAEKLIREAGGRPSFLNYKTVDDKSAYPASLCVSLNSEVVHGIPSEEKILKSGDVASFDIGMEYKKLYTDMAATKLIGNGLAETENFIKIAKGSLEKGIEAARSGARVGDISFAVQSFAEKSGFEVVKKLVGHGIGRAAHEYPEVPNFGKKGTGPVLEEGLVIAIEPMITFGKSDVFLDKTDQWTWKTKDDSMAAHFEHTIIITKNGSEVITRA